MHYQKAVKISLVINWFVMLWICLLMLQAAIWVVELVGYRTSWQVTVGLVVALVVSVCLSLVMDKVVMDWYLDYRGAHVPEKKGEP